MAGLQKTRLVDTVEFEGKVHRSIYSSDNFKVYAMDVDVKKYDGVKANQYGNVTICGDIPVLSSTLTYNINAKEEQGKYGVSYKVVNINTNMPTSLEDVKIFLGELLTENQADVLCSHYPNVLELIKEGRENEIDTSRLKGIGDATMQKIIIKIKENFALLDLVTEFKGKLSLSIVKKIYETYTHPDVFKRNLKRNPYKCLCGLARVGFKTADTILLDLEKHEDIIKFDEPLISSMDRCLGFIMYTLEQNELEGHTYISMIQLKDICDKGVSRASKHFVQAIQDTSIYYDKSKLRVALKRTYDTEKAIAEMIAEGLACSDKWDIDVEKYREVEGGSLTDEQIHSLTNLCENQISLLLGFSGSGKSMSVTALINMLEEHGKSYVLMAPTGLASKVLKDYTKRRCSTIHRGLGYSPMNGFSSNESNKLMVDVVVIDETTMVDVFLMRALLEAIDFNRTKLLLVGDPAQLPSVSCGNVLHDLNVGKLVPKTVLTKIFRYGEGGLMTVATDTRNSKRFLNPDNDVQAFGKDKDYVFINTEGETTTKKLVQLYHQLLQKCKDPKDIMVLTPKNVGETGTKELNKLLQPLANPVARRNGEHVSIGESKYYVGDLVMQTRNNYEPKIYNDSFDDLELETNAIMIPNGDTGVIKEIKYNNEVLIDFDGVVVAYNKNDMQDIQLAYAVTTHKSQGSSSPIIVLVTTKADTFMLNNNLLYVGLTRTKERCYHIGSIKTVNNAIKKKANLQRHTMLVDFLKEAVDTTDKAPEEESINCIQSN